MCYGNYYDRRYNTFYLLMVYIPLNLKAPWFVDFFNSLIFFSMSNKHFVKLILSPIALYNECRVLFVCLIYACCDRELIKF